MRLPKKPLYEEENTMKMMFLGTAAAEGWPGVFCGCEYCQKARSRGGKNIRTRASVLINEDILIDLPPDTYMHSLKYNVDLSKIRHLFITHSHQDHFYPEELHMRTEPFAHLPQDAILNIYGNSKVIEKIKNVVNIEKAKINVNEIHPFETLKGEDFILTALLADHAQEEEDALLYIITTEGKTIFYGHDSGWYPEKTWKYLSENHIDIAIFDCTFGKNNQKKGHMGISGIIEAKDALEKFGSIDTKSICIATHFSHNGGLLHHELEEILNKHGFLVAYDGMILTE